MKPEETRSVKELTDLVRKGTKPKYLFFWGHRSRNPDYVDQSCLSNWFPSKFTVEGTEYLTAEQFMMAEKARLFGDEEVYGQVLESTTPGAAKSLGRKVKGFDESQWLSERFGIVTRGCEAKFTQNQKMKEFLQTTGTKVLVEASPVDKIWGIGLSLDDERATKPHLWNGLNLLGFALMEVRQRMFF